MDLKTFLVIGLLQCTLAVAPSPASTESTEEPPEGYYAFVESPSAVPPSVRPPPYTHSPMRCPDTVGSEPYVSAHNLCGDLNKGAIPRNPMMQSVLGEPYPFELLRNHTLKFLSRTLPILKVDETLPKVTQVIGSDDAEEPLETIQDNEIGRKGRRQGRAQREQLDEEREEEEDEAPREPRKFCDGGGMFCALYRAIQGEPSSPTLTIERRDEPPREGPAPPRYEGPPTPCPAKVEYATPVFAKNYQGAWRYVVQIPYEGYFTQTVEVTRCLQARCHYLDGGCLSSPRWVSLLVAEIFYPTSEESSTPSSPLTTTPPSVQDFQAYQQYLHNRAGLAASTTEPAKPTHCDGEDEIGCFQVRLYYDWFLIPGSCKCWRPDYFARYVRRKNPGSDL